MVSIEKIELVDAINIYTQQVSNTLYADFRLVIDDMTQRVCEEPVDPFDLEFTEFGLKQLTKMLVEVVGERTYVAAIL